MTKKEANPAAGTAGKATGKEVGRTKDTPPKSDSPAPQGLRDPFNPDGGEFAENIRRPQALTHDVSLRAIVGSREFARGFDEVRKGLPFNPDICNWEYERGRCFGFIAPLSMPLRIGGALNPKALKLADAAFSRKLLI